MESSSPCGLAPKQLKPQGFQVRDFECNEVTFPITSDPIHRGNFLFAFDDMKIVVFRDRVLRRDGT